MGSQDHALGMQANKHIFVNCVSQPHGKNHRGPFQSLWGFVPLLLSDFDGIKHVKGVCTRGRIGAAFSVLLAMPVPFRSAYTLANNDFTSHFRQAQDL